MFYFGHDSNMKSTSYVHFTDVFFIGSLYLIKHCIIYVKVFCGGVKALKEE